MQPDAIELQTAKGERTTISTSAVTVASCSVSLRSIWETRLTARKFPQALADGFVPTHMIDGVGIGRGRSLMFVRKPASDRPWRQRSRPVSAVKYSREAAFRRTAAPASGTLSLPARSHLRSRSRPHRSNSANASTLPRLPSAWRSMPATWLLRSPFASASVGSPHISRPGGRIGGKAIEIRIFQNFDSLLGFQQQAVLDGFEIPARNGLLSIDAAARIASP